MRNAVMLSGAKHPVGMLRSAQHDQTPHRVPSPGVLMLRFANSIL